MKFSKMVALVHNVWICIYHVQRSLQRVYLERNKLRNWEKVNKTANKGLCNTRRVKHSNVCLSVLCPHLDVTDRISPFGRCKIYT